jgi:lycopene cyclase domain-containing protein
MTYAHILLLFVILPTALLAMRASRLPRHFWRVPLIISVLAVVWTTPWDNYLVATGVWWYDTARVIGWRIGYVPVEEYGFFIAMSYFTATLFAVLLGWFSAESRPQYATRRDPVRGIAVVISALAVALALTLLVDGRGAGRYLGLLSAWVAPPLALQLWFGSDIIWRARRAVAATVVSATLWLCVADGLAIAQGIWTINPEQTIGVSIGNLPLEEILFFLLTNVLVTCAAALLLAPETLPRLRTLFAPPLQAARS